METETATDFVGWWDRIRPEVGRVLRRYAAPPDASDLEQDLVCLAWQKRNEFMGFEHFRRWALQRARWRALDRLGSGSVLHEVLASGDHVPDALALPPAQESHVALKELAGAIQRLPPKQKAALIGTIEGKSEESLAQELAVSPATVRSLRRFARARLVELFFGKERDR